VQTGRKRWDFAITVRPGRHVAVSPVVLTLVCGVVLLAVVAIVRLAVR
jgi:hypothetical protein